MTRLAYDSTNAQDIPLNAEIVCGYLNGLYTWKQADWDRFPNAVHVGIAVSADFDGGQVLDVETGDATPTQAPGWVQMRRAAGVDPTCYVNRSNWQATKDAFRVLGLMEPHWWLASYDGIATIPVGCVAKQYANEPLAGGHYDLSSVLDYWPGVDKEDDMAFTPEDKAYLDAKAVEVIAADADMLRRAMRGEDPALGFGAEPPITASEKIFQTEAK